MNKNDADERMKKFMSEVRDKTVGAFGTLGAKPDSEHAKKCMTKVKTFLEEIVIIGARWFYDRKQTF